MYRIHSPRKFPRGVFLIRRNGGWFPNPAITRTIECRFYAPSHSPNAVNGSWLFSNSELRVKEQPGLGPDDSRLENDIRLREWNDRPINAGPADLRSCSAVTQHLEWGKQN